MLHDSTDGPQVKQWKDTCGMVAQPSLHLPCRSTKRTPNNQNAPYPNNLRAMIKTLGYTFKEVSQETGISLSALFMYARGARSIPHWAREKIAHLLCCPVEALAPQSQSEIRAFLAALPGDPALPEHVHFGQTTITNNHPRFLGAIESGIASYCELHVSPEQWRVLCSAQTQMSAQELLTLLVEIIEEDHDPTTGEPVSYADRLGFLVGKLVGLLYPDLADNYYSNLIYLEALSWRSKETYQLPCEQDEPPWRYSVVGEQA